MLAVSLMLVSQLMVTGSSGIEEDSNETSSKNCFIKYVLGLKIKGSELNCRCNMKKCGCLESSWSLLMTTGVCQHLGCCPRLSKFMSKLFILGYLSCDLDRTCLVSSAPLLPHTKVSMGRKLGIQVLW